MTIKIKGVEYTANDIGIITCLGTICACGIVGFLLSLYVFIKL